MERPHREIAGERILRHVVDFIETQIDWPGCGVLDLFTDSLGRGESLHVGQEFHRVPIGLPLLCQKRLYIAYGPDVLNVCFHSVYLPRLTVCYFPLRGTRSEEHT